MKFAIKKWKTKNPKIRQSISNLRFWLVESNLTNDQKSQLGDLINDLWENILKECKENKLKIQKTNKRGE